MKFVFVTTILLAAMACDALRVPTSHIRNLDDADPEVPLEPVTRRMTEATFESVLADLDALILDVEELEDQSDALKADLDKCNADLQTCPGGTQPACPGFDNLIDLKDAIDGASDSTQTSIVLCPSTITLTSPIAIQSKNVAITCFDADNSEDCIFDGEATSGLFSVTQGSTVVFGGIKFKDGKASEGAAVYVEASTVDFVDCDFTGNHAVVRTMQRALIIAFSACFWILLNSAFPFSSPGAWWRSVSIRAFWFGNSGFVHFLEQQS